MVRLGHSPHCRKHRWQPPARSNAALLVLGTDKTHIRPAHTPKPVAPPSCKHRAVMAGFCGSAYRGTADGVAVPANFQPTTDLGASPFITSIEVRPTP